MFPVTDWADMLTVGSYQPSLFDRFAQLPFEPGPSVADAAADSIIPARCAAKLDGPQRLRIADIAKNEFPNGHSDYE